MRGPLGSWRDGATRNAIVDFVEHVTNEDGGNSNGDSQMLQYTGGGRPALRLLVLHDDDEREFAYTAGVEKALERARTDGWTVISMKDDWACVFADVTA